MRKNRILALSFLLIMAGLGLSKSGWARPGDAADPLVTKSYVMKVLSENFNPMAQTLASVDSKLDDLLQRTASAQKQLVPFSDVYQAEYSPAIARIYHLGLIKGYPDGTFRPNGPISRSEMATLLVRAKKLTLTTRKIYFKDVYSGYWAYQYIATAKLSGLVTGYPDNTFRPTRQVTRGEAAALIYRAYAKSLIAVQSAPKYSDMTKHWARPYVDYLTKAGVIPVEAGGKFNPDAPATRLWVVEALAKLQ
ncbi:S-layer homology domain-containing protein [Carboxydocella sp. ULO1]|uniref:S-layer homology domain-containing protein n=1 Tax=Carboxydocella sp. ULO1 TaxID=1926599 RepID=UPI0009ABF550|nr:S-layer homology domain-containing protein [Carboxydocella sp. ULO1]GAW29451.1 Uncharacterized protein XD63_1231 [Carboxydocella sp. ULO1]